MGRLIGAGILGLAVAAGCTPALHRYSRADVGRVADHDVLEQYWGLSKSRNLAMHVLDRVDPGAVHIAVESTVRLLQLPADEADEVPGGEFRQGIQRFEVVGRHGDWLQVVEAQWCVPSRHRAWRYVQRAGFIPSGNELQVVTRDFELRELGIPAGTVVRQRDGQWEIRPDDGSELWITSAEEMDLHTGTEYRPTCPDYELGYVWSEREQVHGRVSGMRTDASIIIRDGDSSSMVWMWAYHHGVALRLRTTDELAFEPDPPGVASFARRPCGIRMPVTASVTRPHLVQPDAVEHYRPFWIFNVGQSLYSEDGAFVGFLWGDVRADTGLRRHPALMCFRMSDSRADAPTVCTARDSRPFGASARYGAVPYWDGWFGELHR